METIKPLDLKVVKTKLQNAKTSVDEYQSLWFSAAVNEINNRLDVAVSYGVRSADFSFGTLQNVVLNSETDPKEKNMKHKLLNQVGKEVLMLVKQEFIVAGYLVKEIDEVLFTVGVPHDS